jgi:hypothetical protein
MPLDLFPIWIQIQYDMIRLAYKGFVYLEMRRAVWGLPQAGILVNKRLRWRLAPVFRTRKHPGPVVSCVQAYFFHVSGRRLWSQIRE